MCSFLISWVCMMAVISFSSSSSSSPSSPSSSLLRLKLELVVLGGDEVVLEQLELTELSQLANYSQPHAPGALLKAAFICAEVVEFPSATPLAQQLSDKFGCGFRLQSMSNVPQGSGGCGLVGTGRDIDCQNFLLNHPSFPRQVLAPVVSWVELYWQHCGGWLVRSTPGTPSSMLCVADLTILLAGCVDGLIHQSVLCFCRCCTWNSC